MTNRQKNIEIAAPNLVGHKHKDSYDLTEVNQSFSNQPKLPVRLCKVNLCPVRGDLMDGVEFRMVVVETHSVKLVDPPPPPGFVSIPLANLHKIGIDTYLLRVESIVKDSAEPWIPFIVSGCSLVHQDSDFTKTDNRTKVIQYFTLEITYSHLCPCLQLICNHWRVKFNGEYYSRNDVLSIFLPSSSIQTVPNFIHVKPDNDQTIVPMRKGQRLNLLVDKCNQSIDFDVSQEKESAFDLNSVLDMGKNYPGLGYPLSIYVFDLARELETNEFFEITKKSLGFYWQPQSKMVLVVSPEDNYGGSYVPVFEPVHDCRVYTGGYDGVKLRYLSSVSLRIHETCPARIVYSAKIGNFYEYKIFMKSPCHSLLLVKDPTGWIVKVTK